MREVVMGFLGASPLCPLIAADGGDIVSDWKQFGLLGLVLGMVFWMQKTFMEGTLAEQRNQTAILKEISASVRNTEGAIGRQAVAIDQLNDRITRHIEADERWQRDMLRSRGGRPEDEGAP